MKFLVITKSKHPVPPEMGLTLVDAMGAWSDQLTESGKAEAMWSIAGRAGGGGILNVDSLEELDAIMIQFPFGPFFDIEVFPLVDLHESLQRLKQAMQMMGGG